MVTDHWSKSQSDWPDKQLRAVWFSIESPGSTCKEIVELKMYKPTREKQKIYTDFVVGFAIQLDILLSVSSNSDTWLRAPCSQLSAKRNHELAVYFLNLWHSVMVLNNLYFFSLTCRFTPNFMRLGAWNIVMFMCFEQFKRLFSSFSSDNWH